MWELPSRRSTQTKRGRADDGPLDSEAIRVTDEAFLRNIRNLAEDGAYGKACKLLTSEGFHDMNDPSVLTRLQALHPAGPG